MTIRNLKKKIINYPLHFIKKHQKYLQPNCSKLVCPKNNGQNRHYYYNSNYPPCPSGHYSFYPPPKKSNQRKITLPYRK